MARIALLDVNVLVALFDPDHVHHDLAHDWFADRRADGWATCPMTEAGFIRVVSNPNYQPDPPRPAVAAAQLRRFCASGHHHFWPDALSPLTEKAFAFTGVRGYRQITDVYLLGLARHLDGTLATFDRSIPLSSVLGATSRHLTVVTPD
jgi:toxin-antitoxin system PIN domain toxin